MAIFIPINKTVQIQPSLYKLDTNTLLIPPSLLLKSMVSGLGDSHGCRQGSSLSYLLFVSIELLTQFIRDDHDIKGIIIGKEEHKISPYEDDVFFC